MLTGCRPQRAGGSAPAGSEEQAATPSASFSPSKPVPGLVTGRAATAEDYRWFAGVDDLAEGFCFTWVRGRTERQVIKETGGKELERIGWEQLVGSGDGQRSGADRYFYGVANLEDWALLVEDNGTFGTTDAAVRPLSQGTTLLSYHRAGDGHGRVLVLDDGVVRLHFDPLQPDQRTGRAADALEPVIEAAGFGRARRMRAGDQTAYRTYCMQAAFALVERLTGIGLTDLLLEDSTYLLTSVPR